MSERENHLCIEEEVTDCLSDTRLNRKHHKETRNSWFLFITILNLMYKQVLIMIHCLNYVSLFNNHTHTYIYMYIYIYICIYI